jgi:hypothetical protein
MAHLSTFKTTCNYSFIIIRVLLTWIAILIRGWNGYFSATVLVAMYSQVAKSEYFDYILKMTFIGSCMLFTQFTLSTFFVEMVVTWSIPSLFLLPFFIIGGTFLGLSLFVNLILLKTSSLSETSAFNHPVDKRSFLCGISQVVSVFYQIFALEQLSKLDMPFWSLILFSILFTASFICGSQLQ